MSAEAATDRSWGVLRPVTRIQVVELLLITEFRRPSFRL